MRLRQRLREVGTALAWAGLVSAAATAAGCDGGAGGVVTASSGGREDPGTTRDVPPSGRDDTSGNCVECDVRYACTGPQGNNPGGIQLSTSNGTCTQALIDLICGGSLFGASGCAGGGGGPFSCGPVTCVPEQGVQPQPGGGAGTNGGVSSSGGAADGG